MSLDEASNPNTSFLRSWKPWAIVLIPAVVSGIFAIGPTIYQELTKPRAVLSFRAVSGPTIGTGGFFRQISVISIENAGKASLTSVTLDVDSSESQIESSAVNSAPGIKPVAQTTPSHYTANIDRMLPSEVISVSLMTSSQTPQASLKIGLRSNEILGSEAIPSPSTNRPELLSSLLAVLGGTVAMLSMIGFKMSSGTFLFRAKNDRPDIVTFICGLSGSVGLSDDLLYREHEVSYRRAGDLFLFSGLNGDDDNRQRCVVGLRALLSSVDSMADLSASIIRENLKILGHDLTDQEFLSLRENAKRLSGFLDARKNVQSMFNV